MSCSGGDGTQDGIQGVFIDSVIQHPDPNAAQGGITWNFGGYTVLEVEVDYPNDSFRVWAAHYGEAPKLICDSSIDTYGSADLNPGREQATGEAGWSGIQLTHFLTGGQAEPGVRPNMYIDYVESITSLSPIDFPGGLPVDVGTPAYIQGMADYSVQRLNTASGNDTLLQAYQAAGIPNQFPGGGNDIDNIQRAWGGGIGNPERRKIHFQGGGHGNSAHNGVLSYDFNGDTLPTGFVIEPNSHTLTTDEVTANTRTFTDGRPNSYHTYDQIGLVNDVLYRFAGAIWNPGGGGQPFCDSYEFATQSWNTASLGTQIPDMPGGALRSVGMGMVSDSVTGKILYLPRGGGQGHFYRVATNDWSTVTNPLNYGQTASHFTAHHDERRRSGRTRVFVVPVVNSNILEVDWENEQLFDGGLWSPSDTAVQNYISMTSLYDPHPTDPNLDRLWFTGVQADLATSMPMEIYAMNLSTYTVTTTPLTGDQLNWSSSYGNASVRGTYKRSAIFQGWGVIALCEATDHAYVVKLPLWGS
jgi:hypothetical protein